MAKKCGPYSVHVTNDKGETKWFYPGDDFGAWEKFVDSPLAFEGSPEVKAETEEVQETAEDREARLRAEADKEAEKAKPARGGKAT